MICYVITFFYSIHNIIITFRYSNTVAKERPLTSLVRTTRMTRIIIRNPGTLDKLFLEVIYYQAGSSDGKYLLALYSAVVNRRR